MNGGGGGAKYSSRGNGGPNISYASHALAQEEAFSRFLVVGVFKNTNGTQTQREGVVCRWAMEESEVAEKRPAAVKFDKATEGYEVKPTVHDSFLSMWCPGPQISFIIKSGPTESL